MTLIKATQGDLSPLTLNALKESYKAIQKRIVELGEEKQTIETQIEDLKTMLYLIKEAENQKTEEVA